MYRFFSGSDCLGIPNIIGGLQEVDFMIIIIFENMFRRISGSNYYVVAKKKVFFSILARQ